MKIIIAIPVAHSYFWQDSCISQLQKFDPGVRDVQIVVVSNAYDWCPSIQNVMDWSMDDDLNISEAEAAVFEFMNLANKLMAENKLSKKEAMGCIKQMRAFDTILGILDFEEEKIPEEITGLVKKREGARKNKEWKLADELRGKIKKKGYSIDDTDSGSVVKKL